MGCITDNNCAAELLTALLSNKGVQEIVDAAERVLGNPLMVADVSGKVYFYTHNVETDDPVWNEVVNCGYCSSKLRETFRSLDMCQPVANHAIPVIFPPICEKCRRRMTGKLLTHNVITGYIIVLENNREFTEQDVNNARTVCEVISIELQKNPTFAYLNGTADESLIYDFLDGQDKHTEVYAERMRITGWKPKNNFYLLTLASENDAEAYQMSNYFRVSFESAFPSCRTVFHNGHVVVLLDLDSQEDTAEAETTVTGILRSHSLTCGMSPYFKDITELRLHYKQSLRALEFGRLFGRGGPLFRYNDVYFYDLLMRLDKVQSIDSFCCPEARRLMDYDEENSTEFYKTCYEYLVSGCNMAKTAKKLFIHRNTIAYRIEKIQEIASVNLNDGEDCYRMFLSFKIIDLLKGKN